MIFSSANNKIKIKFVQLIRKVIDLQPRRPECMSNFRISLIQKFFHYFSINDSYMMSLLHSQTPYFSWQKNRNTVVFFSGNLFPYQDVQKKGKKKKYLFHGLLLKEKELHARLFQQVTIYVYCPQISKYAQFLSYTLAKSNVLE